MLGNCVGGGLWKGWGKGNNIKISLTINEGIQYTLFIQHKSKIAFFDSCF